MYFVYSSLPKYFLMVLNTFYFSAFILFYLVITVVTVSHHLPIFNRPVEKTCNKPLNIALLHNSFRFRPFYWEWGSSQPSLLFTFNPFSNTVFFFGDTYRKNPVPSRIWPPLTFSFVLALASPLAHAS